MSANFQTLADKIAVLIAERERTWPAGRLAKNAAERQDLIDRFDPAQIVQPGEGLGSFTLLPVEGGELKLETLVEEGPAVLLFFRFGGCPACSIALPHYDLHLRPALERANVSLLAVSPQLPERLNAFREQLGLKIPIASDPDNRLARHLGLTFVPSPLPEGPPPQGWIGDVTGTGTWELPQPAVVVLDRHAKVSSVMVSPDWLKRPEADDVLQLVAEVSTAEPT